MPEFDYLPYKSWHRKLIKEGSQYEEAYHDKELRAWAYRQVEGVTLLIDGEVAAIMGVVPTWNGVAEATFIPSELFYKYKLSALKKMRMLVELACETYALHRLQANTLSSQPKHGRFLEFLGFKKEATMEKYGPMKQNMDLYAYIPREDL